MNNSGRTQELLFILKQMYDSRHRTDINEEMYVIVGGRIMTLKQAAEYNQRLYNNDDNLIDEDGDY